MKCNSIITIITIVFIIGLSSYCVYNLNKCEKYIKIKDLDIINPNNLMLKEERERSKTGPENKYDSHLYKKRKRY